MRGFTRLQQSGLRLCAAAIVAAAGLGGCARPVADAIPPRFAGEPEPIVAGRAPEPGEYPQPFDVRHYDIHLSLPDAGNQITGSADITLDASGGTERLTLDFTGLAVTTVTVNGTAAAFRHDEGKLHVQLPSGARRGDLRVRVEYAGVPDDGLIIRSNVHGRRAVFADNWPNRARFWFPAIDHPADKATASFTIEAPAEWQVVANGVRTGDPEPAGTPSRRTWRWRIDAPISTYNMVVGATSFDVRTLGTVCVVTERCVEVSTWLFPESSTTGAAPFRRAVEMVEYFSGLIAPYPYRTLAHVQSATRFGGMENATAVFYDEQSLAQGRDIEGTVAHETVHQWFGNAVTIADWRDLWLSEGLATYFATVFFEHADGVERLRQRMEADRVRVVRSETAGQPIVDTSERDLFERLNANTYQKAAWVLHMLRGVIGDEDFFEGIRRYYRRHEHGTAATEDLRRAMEEASGRDLEWFFEQWVFSPGYPRFRVTSAPDPRTRETTVVIEQTQPVSWPTFRTPLTLEIRAPTGSTRRIVAVDERRETLRLSERADVAAIVVDPDGWVLKDLETVDESAGRRSATP